MLYKEIPSNPTLNLTGLSYLSEERHFFSALAKYTPTFFLSCHSERSEDELLRTLSEKSEYIN